MKSLLIFPIVFLSLSVFGQDNPDSLDSLFLKAIQNNDIQKVQHFIEKGANVNTRDTSEASALMWAAYRSDLEMVKLLVKAGADVRQKGMIYLEGGGIIGNLLAIAAGFGKLSMLQYFVETCGIDIEDRYDIHAPHEDDWTALQFALGFRQVACVEYLMEQGADTSFAIAEMADYYRWAGKYQRALPLMKKALEQAGNKYERESFEYALRVHELAMLYEDMGKYPKALPLLLWAKKVVEKVLGKEHIQYGIMTNNLGKLYHAMGEIEQSLAYVTEAHVLLSKILGKDHPFYAGGLGNIGLLYKITGDYEKALPLLLEARELCKKHKENPQFPHSRTLDNLGMLYQEIGEYEKAIQVQEEALGYIEKLHGTLHPLYALTVNNLGLAYYYQGNHDKALESFLKAIDINKQDSTVEESVLSSRIQNAAAVHMEKGDYETSKRMITESLALIETSLGKSHPDYGQSLHNLARVNYHLGAIDQAAKLYQKALDIYEKSIGTQFYEYGNTLNQLAYIYKELGDTNQRATLVQSLYKHLVQQIQNRFFTLNDRSQYALLNKMQPAFAHIESFAFEADGDSDINSLAYNQQLILKGLLQGNRKSLLHALRTHPDSLIQTQFHSWESLHRLIARQYLLPKSQRLEYFDSLRQHVQTLEITLSQLSSDFRQARKQVSWKDVQKSLQPGEIAIEFSHFPYLQSIDKKGKQVVYVAYVLRPSDSQPQVVQLFEEEEMKSLLENGSEERSSYLSGLFASAQRGIKPKRKQKSFGAAPQKNLYELIWKPLESYLNGAERIYVAPSGLLHKINLAAIPKDKKNLISDLFEIHPVGSTRALVYQDRLDKIDNQTVSIWGGIRYDMDSLAIVSSSSNKLEEDVKVDINSLSQSENFALRGSTDSWEFLPGTVKEMDQISSLFEEVEFDIETHTSYAGNEDRFHQIGTNGASPRILHIATHGYFFPDPSAYSPSPNSHSDKLPPVQLSEHPMVRSGLILAGANHTWTGGAPIPGKEDGILTAYEISQLDLSGTELVVLSACETGLGDISGNEGVYGLQRAFKIAGVKYLIMSLWQVPDQQTSELMSFFYKNWLQSDLSIHAAFAKAQKQMRNIYEDPYLWAGFVLVE